MSDRLADVEARIATARQLAQVVGAIRAVAAARARAARARLDAVRAHAGIVARAIGRALALPDGMDRGGGGATARRRGHVVLAFSAEQGFAGSFGAEVLERASRLLDAAAGGELFLVGDRGLAQARERGLAVAWSTAMILHDEQAALLAQRIVEALWRRLDGGAVSRVTLVHAIPEAASGLGVVERPLMPFDFGRFPPSREASPLTLLPPERLLARLAEEYVFAEVCEAAVLSFAAENEARTRAMTAARQKVAETLETLTGRARRLRQEAITDEIVELATGSLGRP